MCLQHPSVPTGGAAVPPASAAAGSAPAAAAADDDAADVSAAGCTGSSSSSLCCHGEFCKRSQPGTTAAKAKCRVCTEINIFNHVRTPLTLKYKNTSKQKISSITTVNRANDKHMETQHEISELHISFNVRMAQVCSLCSKNWQQVLFTQSSSCLCQAVSEADAQTSY